MFVEVLLDLILAQTDSAVSTPLFTFDRSTCTFTRKGNGHEVSGQHALHTGPN